MDERTQMFLDLVDCQPEEVLDIPPATPPSPEKQRAAIGETKIHFGKHKGKRLKEIPGSYLTWALDQTSTNRSFRKFQLQAKVYLGN